MNDSSSIVNLVGANVQLRFNPLIVDAEPVEQELDGESLVVLSLSNSSGIDICLWVDGLSFGSFDI